MNVRITFFFESVQPATQYASASLGWTESWYAASETVTSIDAWFNHPDVLAYLRLRVRILPPIYRIAWVRVSDEQHAGSFKIQALLSLFGTAPGPSNGTQGEIHGQVNCAVLVDLAKLPNPTQPLDRTHHRKFLLRGLPVDVINGNVIDPNFANWKNIQVFFNWLASKETGTATPPTLPIGVGKNNTIGLRYQNPANVAYLPAPNIGINAQDSRSIDLAQLLPAPPGAKYQLTGFPAKMRALNRLWTLRVAAALPTPVTTLGRARRDLPENLIYTAPGTGKYREFDPVYGLFDQYTIIGLRNKKTGRLFHQLRGRSSNR
jgi:hypothetical protein